MYGDSTNKVNTYSSVVKREPESPELSSLVEQCHRNEVDWGDKLKIQESWSASCTAAITQIADLNPYLPEVIAGEEIPAVQAVAWVKGTRGGFD